MVGGWQKPSISKNAIFWILNFSDGDKSLKKISERSGIAYDEIKKTAELLIKSNLLKKNRIIALERKKIICYF